MYIFNTVYAVPLVLILFLLSACMPFHAGNGDMAHGKVEDRKVYSTWRTHAGDAGQTHYSNLDQINIANVTQLKVAWEYHAGDVSVDSGTQIQCNPIIIDDLLYATTATLKVVALRADTGEEVWRFDPFAELDTHPQGINRGVSYWESGNDRRILFSAGAYLYALNADTGQPVASFGREGRVDLRQGLGRDYSRLSVDATSPGAVYKNLIIMGSRVGEGPGSAPGHVRAFDIRTGEQSWIFNTIPKPGEFGYKTWPPEAWQYAGGANAWAAISIDQERGIAFVPTGSATYDFYGRDRIGDNLFANSLIALDANTGKRLWHFQTTHHDLWDRDLPAAPNLVRLKQEAREFDAVAQVTKQGFVFMFDRVTGRPIFPIEERSVPVSTLPGEAASLTQPFPTAPPPFSRQSITRDQLAKRTDEIYQEALERFEKLKTERVYEPPSTDGTLVVPGTGGGASWGGAAFDPETTLLYVNSTEIPVIIEMMRLEKSMESEGRGLYLQNCAVCHGMDLTGDAKENIPSLTTAAEKFSLPKLVSLIMSGKGRMPGFAQMKFEQLMALSTYLLEGEKAKTDEGSEKGNSAFEENDQYNYIHKGYTRFMASDGAPAVAPPWGLLTAIDLSAGEISWQRPLGDHPKYKGTGNTNYGGPLVTSSGLLFIAATADKRLRAFDKTTGQLLWETELPAAGFATPSTYEVNGKQYLVIAAGGGKMGVPSGDSYIAFSLP